MGESVVLCRELVAGFESVACSARGALVLGWDAVILICYNAPGTWPTDPLLVHKQRVAVSIGAA